MNNTTHTQASVCALFISDLHLDSSRPEITELFLAFLREEARHADALYIPGDLFEAYLGDDDDDALMASVASALKEVSDNGTFVAFVRGNRDFLLGREYAARAGMHVLSDPCVINLAGEATLLLHGDLLCSDDTAYQEIRRHVRNPEWQKGMLSRSLEERRAFAETARQSSAAHQQSMSSLDIADATQEAVIEMFRRYGVKRMIHGHTHRPAIHTLTVDDAPRQRIVLGDWYEQGSVLRVFHDGRYELATLPLSKITP